MPSVAGTEGGGAGTAVLEICCCGACCFSMIPPLLLLPLLLLLFGACGRKLKLFVGTGADCIGCVGKTGICNSKFVSRIDTVGATCNGCVRNNQGPSVVFFFDNSHCKKRNSSSDIK